MESSKNKYVIHLNVNELKDILNESIENSLRELKPAKIKEDQEIKVYRRKDLSKLFNVSIQTIHTWVKTGVLPKPKKIGRICVFSEDDIKNILQGKNGKK